MKEWIAAAASTLLAVLLATGSVRALSPGNSGKKQVLVEVQYESLCPDSIRFINDQLIPAYKTLGPEHMVVQFVPYGKATTYATSTGYVFRCQHGSRECYGNKLQACALARLLGDNSKQVKYVGCVMSTENPSSPGDQCATDVGLQASEVRSCATGREGEVLLASMGELTPASIKFVPTVRFNKEHKLSNQSTALNDLLKPLCERLNQGLSAEEQIAACASA